MKNKDLLIVDDDESIQNLFELAAKSFNINIFKAQNGSEALSKCEKQTFRLVITDLNMPKMNGIDFIKRLREMPKYKNYPIVIVTANLVDFDSQIAFLDKVHVIEKPIQLKTIKSLFGNMFKDANEAKSLRIDAKSITERLAQSYAEKSSTLIEIITKEKPLYEISSENITLEQMTDHFFISYPIDVWGELFTIVFCFDSTMAGQVMDKFHFNHSKKGNEARSYAISLQKICDVLMKKSLEMISHDLDNIKIRIPTAVGNHLEKNNYVFPIKLKHKSILIKNSVGNLRIHIINEH